VRYHQSDWYEKCSTKVIQAGREIRTAGQLRVRLLRPGLQRRKGHQGLLASTELLLSRGKWPFGNVVGESGRLSSSPGKIPSVSEGLDDADVKKQGGARPGPERRGVDRLQRARRGKRLPEIPPRRIGAGGPARRPGSAGHRRADARRWPRSRPHSRAASTYGRTVLRSTRASRAAERSPSPAATAAAPL